MDITITVLAENSAAPGGIGEWGFSALVETEGKRVLFDTGAGTAAPQSLRLEARPETARVRRRCHFQ